MNTPLLDQIHDPEDLKTLQKEELVPLCEEIRAFLLESVSRTGGHLASNLGAIELTVALHRAMNSPMDKIIFDVGHQCYTHKLLTGRKDGFDGLRKLNGLSGFPNPRESIHDAFVAGHGNTAISLAIGMAQAKKIKGEPGKVIAVVGDGAFTGGMVYEGLNNISNLDNLIIILNDNKMSISKNVGSMARYLTSLRTDPNYFRVKVNMQSFLDSIPVVGTPARKALQHTKQTVRRSIYKSTMFEEMGFLYVGPVDGNDVCQMTELLQNIQSQLLIQPVFLHVVTVKGKGYDPAEKNSGQFHGVSAFALDDPDLMPPSPSKSFSGIFGQELTELGKKNTRICAITAAMKYGTGLQDFAHAYRDRFFDVGMAEQHAVTFAAGLASSGFLPVVAIYSTFLQRSYDQIIHDVNLLKEPVLFAVDRAGLVPGDGETHQGIYDPAFLSQIGIPTWSPANYQELRVCLRNCLAHPTGPQAIRYPRGSQSPRLAALGCDGAPYRKLTEGRTAGRTAAEAEPETMPAGQKNQQGPGADEEDRITGAGFADEQAAGGQTEGRRIALVSYGSETEDILEAADLLAERGVDCDCYQLLQIYPIADGLIRTLCGYPVVLFAEEGINRGGIGEHLAVALQQAGWKGLYLYTGVDNEKLTHATVPELKRLMGLDGRSLAEKVLSVSR